MKYLVLFLIAFNSYAGSIRIMSYNVENLFDTEHDKNKDDWTFVPMTHPEKLAGCNLVQVEYYRKTCLETDWTPEKFDIKLGQIEKAVDFNGSAPDILGLIEVENRKAVELLRKKLKYKRLLITNSPDKRGVEVALLFNPSADLVYLGSQEHKLELTPSGITAPTRNILEVRFQLKDAVLYVYVNHWPSQQSSPGARMSAAEQLLKIIKPKVNDPRSKIIVMGDFNVTDNDKPNPFNDLFTKNTGMVDLYSKLTPAQRRAKVFPEGTYFYTWDFNWHRLDRMIVNNGFLQGAPKADPQNFSIVAPAFLSREYEQKNPDRPHFGEKKVIPWGYWHNAYSVDRAGFSDHYPVQTIVEF